MQNRKQCSDEANPEQSGGAKPRARNSWIFPKRIQKWEAIFKVTALDKYKKL